MLSDEKNAQPANPLAKYRAESRVENSKKLNLRMAFYLARVETVNACFESLQSALRTIMCALSQDEIQEDDAAAIHDLILLCMSYADIGYSRYLLEGGEAEWYKCTFKALSSWKKTKN